MPLPRKSDGLRKRLTLVKITGNIGPFFGTRDMNTWNDDGKQLEF